MSCTHLNYFVHIALCLSGYLHKNWNSFHFLAYLYTISAAILMYHVLSFRQCYRPVSLTMKMMALLLLLMMVMMVMMMMQSVFGDDLPRPNVGVILKEKGSIHTSVSSWYYHFVVKIPTVDDLSPAEFPYHPDKEVENILAGLYGQIMGQLRTFSEDAQRYLKKLPRIGGDIDDRFVTLDDIEDTAFGTDTFYGMAPLDGTYSHKDLSVTRQIINFSTGRVIKANPWRMMSNLRPGYSNVSMGAVQFGTV